MTIVVLVVDSGMSLREGWSCRTGRVMAGRIVGRPGGIRRAAREEEEEGIRSGMRLIGREGDKEAISFVRRRDMEGMKGIGHVAASSIV